MGLGVYFSEDIAHILRGVGEGVRLLVVQRGLRDVADAAYVAGYWAALRAVATSLGLHQLEFGAGDRSETASLIREISALAQSSSPRWWKEDR